MDPFESIRATFFQECDEQLAALEEGLMAMERGETDAETVNAVFRAVHSIKGGAGAFGYEALVAFAHVFETMLDDVRAKRLAPTREVIAAALRGRDCLADHVTAARAGGAAPNDMALRQELEAFSAAPGAPAAAAPSLPPAPAADEFGFVPLRISLDPPAPPGLKIRFAPKEALAVNGHEPLVLLREVAGLGDLKVSADLAALPPLAEIDPERIYIAWDGELSGESIAADAVTEIFDFASDDCELSVTEAAPAAAAPLEPLPLALPLETPAPVAAAPVAAATVPDAPAAPAEGDSGNAAREQRADTIRVETEKVDRMVNLVGELVIHQAVIAQTLGERVGHTGSPAQRGMAELEQLTRELQDAVMAIRAQPVKSVFQRMPRLVRELAAQTGKRVRLEMTGEGTEVDKTVIERLGEPLIHMIRNAVDHGLETPEGRQAAGKEAEGVVRLSAQHRGGRIVIEVSDDGRGIDRARVRQKAIERGLIDAAAPLSDEEIDNLIFLPGFSTAQAVSNISGRGVGMDVVRRNIQALGGRITIASTPGKGSSMSLTLPLTLAVLDGMVVAVGDRNFVVPVGQVVETLRPRPEEVKRLGDGDELLAVRGSFVPLIRVGDVLDVPDAEHDPSRAVVILAEAEGLGRAALVVDDIRGQRQVVIKSLEPNYGQVPGVAGATILGDGRVALIVDVERMVEQRRSDLGLRAAA